MWFGVGGRDLHPVESLTSTRTCWAVRTPAYGSLPGPGCIQLAGACTRFDSIGNQHGSQQLQTVEGGCVVAGLALLRGPPCIPSARAWRGQVQLPRFADLAAAESDSSARFISSRVLRLVCYPVFSTAVPGAPLKFAEQLEFAAHCEGNAQIWGNGGELGARQLNLILCMQQQAIAL